MERIWLGIGGGLWLGLVLGCPTSDFVCQSSADCVGGSAPGTCEDDGHCSFPDEACPSGQRYGEFSGPSSGQCTAPGEASTSSTGPTTTSGSTSGSGGSTSSSLTMGGTGGSSDALSDASTAAIADGTSSAGDNGTTDPASSGPIASESSSAGTMVDPYGPCSDGCTLPGATCLTTNQGESVCASPCADPTMPAESCPDPLVAGYAVVCASTQMGGGDFCVLLCADGMCPGTMFCREGICVFEP